MVVRAEIYSGRPNPEWAIASPLADELEIALRALPEIDGPCGMPDDLGYRGVTVMIARAQGDGACWWLANGLAGSGDRCFVDFGRKIERTLLDSGRAAIGSSTVDNLLSAFSS